MDLELRDYPEERETALSEAIKNHIQWLQDEVEYWDGRQPSRVRQLKELVVLFEERYPKEYAEARESGYVKAIPALVGEVRKAYYLTEPNGVRRFIAALTLPEEELARRESIATTHEQARQAVHAEFATLDLPGWDNKEGVANKAGSRVVTLDINIETGLEYPMRLDGPKRW